MAILFNKKCKWQIFLPFSLLSVFSMPLALAEAIIIIIGNRLQTVVRFLFFILHCSGHDVPKSHYL